jgi:anaerobic selenocysteine-containing dehydrogenase
LRRGYEEYPLLTKEISQVPSAHMPTFWQTVMTGEPYPIRCIVIFGSNAHEIYTNLGYVRNALRKPEFLAVCDMFLTPTAKLADIGLPASSWLERDNIITTYQADLRHVLIEQKAVDEIGESKNDMDICIQLAKRFGLEGRFPRIPRASWTTFSRLAR